MDLELRLKGNLRAPLEAEVVRDLDPADIAFLSESRGTKPVRISRLRDSHHHLAMCLAEGMSEQLAAQVAGYSISRVSILRGDPMFEELVEHYRRETVREEMADLGARMRTLGISTVDELMRRIEEEPGTFSHGELAMIFKLAADRTGFGPQTRNMNLNVNVDLASKLEAARKRVGSNALPAPGSSPNLSSPPSDGLDPVDLPSLSQLLEAAE